MSDDFDTSEFEFDLSKMVVPPAPPIGTVVKSALPTAAGMIGQAVGGGIRAIGDVTGWDAAAEAGAGIAEQSNFNIEQARPPGMTLGQEFVQSGLANVGAMAPALLAGGIGGVPAVLGGAGAMAFGPTYHATRETGYGVGRSLTHGAIDSVIEIGTELLPAKYLFGDAGKPLLKRLVAAAATDYGGELAATFLQNLNAAASYRPDMTIRDMVNDLIMTAGSQLIAAPGTALLGGAISSATLMGRKLQERAGVQPAQVGAKSQGIPGQNLLGVTPPKPFNLTDEQAQLMLGEGQAAQPAQAIEPPDLAKSQWVQEHAKQAGYRDAGQAVMRMDAATRPIVLGPLGVQTQETLGSLQLRAGDVVVAGPYWEGHPKEMMELYQKEAQAFNKEVLGNKAAIVLVTGLPTNVSGVAVTGFDESGAPIAYINPRHIYENMLDRKAVGKTSLHAEAEAQYSLYHEFGHVLRMFAMQDASDAKQKALESEFAFIARDIVDRNIKATNFVQKYMSPWKVAKGFGLDDYGGVDGQWSNNSANRFVQYIMDATRDPNPDMDVSNVSALSFLETLAKRTGGRDWTDVFNFDEFVGEQHARWMRSTKRAIGSPLGEFFADMNQLMTKYFNWLVRSGRVGKPGDLGPTEAYKKFITALVRSNKVLTEGRVVTPEILKQKGLNPRKLFYDLNPSGGEEHNSDMAGLTLEEAQRPEVVTLANRWRSKWTETGSPFFLNWGGNWELAKYTKELNKALQDTDSRALGDARQNIRSMQAKLLEAKLSAQKANAPQSIIAALDRMIAEVPGALRGEMPRVEVMTNVYGQPLPVYHGTNTDWVQPQFARGFTNVGGEDAERVWFATPNKVMANTYAMFRDYAALPHVMKMYIKGQKILQVPSTNISGYDTDHYLSIIQDAREIGADLIWLERVYDYGYETNFSGHQWEQARGAPVFIFFNPEQVKSAWGNSGTFAPETGNLFWDRTAVAAAGDEEPVRKLGIADPQIDIAPYVEAGNIIRKKWWILEQLRRLGVDLRSWEMNVQQWQHIAKRLPSLQFVQNFVDLSRAFQEEKNLNVKFPSETVINGYKQLGKTQIDQLRNILDWETTQEVHKTEVTNGYLPDGRPSKIRYIKDVDAFKMEVQKALGFVPDEYVLDYYQRIRTGMENQLQSLRAAAAEKAGVLGQLTAEEMGDFADLLVETKTEDLAKLQELLDKPQYPWSRFGKYAIIIEREYVDDKGRKQLEPLHYRHFEFERDRDTAFAKLRVDPGQTKHTFNYFDDYAGFSVIPQTFVESVIRRAGFDPDSKDADQLRRLAAVQRNTNLFKRFEEDFKLTDRTEHDVLKDYADFSGHLAALTAKVKYRRHLSMTVAEANRAVRALQSQQVNSSDLELLSHYMQQQLQYGMQPQDELQTLRSFITKAMLFGNVRSAAMNFTAVLNTMAHLDGLVSKYNVLSWPALLPTIKSAIQAVGNINNMVERLPADERQFLQEMEARGVTDQSYSYHLAAAADSGIFYRLNRSKSKWGTKVAELGMLPFRAMERYTRRVGALTAYRVAKAHPEVLATGQTPSDFAKAVLYETQADYTALNRPRSQQGLRAAALVFFTYTQNMAALFGGTLGGATSARLFLIYTMLGGLMGLPFAEDLMNLSNWVWRRLFKGEQDLRIAARDVANYIPGMGPVVLRGVMHNIGGFDLSHSVSLGRIIPGMDSFAQSNMKSVDESFGSFAFDLMGPLGGYARGWLQAGAAMVDDPSAQSLIRLGQAALPSQRSLMDLALFATQSGDPSIVKGYAGQVITRDEDGVSRPLTMVELGGKALGFNPEVVSRNREIDFLQREIATYWTQRRKRLLDAFWQGKQLRDPEMLSDARDAIHSFNEKIPDKALRISGKDISASMKQRERIRKLEEAGKSPVKRFQTLYSDVEAAFEG